MKRKATAHGREPSPHKFYGLMPFMVREILLCSSAYDAFLLEEDGRLEERLFSAYDNLSLSLAPRITHVTTAERSMELLAERRFDLVITVVRLEDTDAAGLSRRVRAEHPLLPIVLLAFDEATCVPAGRAPRHPRPGLPVDRRRPNPDRRHQAHRGRAQRRALRTAGCGHPGGRSSPGRYSSLALLYADDEPVADADPEVNALHRLMRMRPAQDPSGHHLRRPRRSTTASRITCWRSSVTCASPQRPRDQRRPGLAQRIAEHPDVPLRAVGRQRGPAPRPSTPGTSKRTRRLLGRIRRFLGALASATSSSASPTAPGSAEFAP
jgi:CheY-like chemotaxis protein